MHSVKSLTFDNVEQEQEVFGFYFSDPSPKDIAHLLKDLLDDLGSRFAKAGLPFTSRKIAIRGRKKFSATARLISEFQSVFPVAINREITVQLAHFVDSRSLGMAHLTFARSTSGSPFGENAQMLSGAIGATVGVLGWTDLINFWLGLADQSGCDWAVFGEPLGSRKIGRCTVGYGDGLVTSAAACEAVFEVTGLDPREVFRSVPVGKTRVALFRDLAKGTDDPTWSDTISLLAEYVMKRPSGSEAC